MTWRLFVLAAALAAGSSAVSYAQDEVPQSGPAENGQPAWFIYKAPAATAPARPRSVPDTCNADIGKWCSGKTGMDALTCLYANVGEITGQCKMAVEGPRYRVATPDATVPICDNSPICTYNTGAGLGNFTNPDGVRNGMGGYIRVEWASQPINMGWKPVYPIALPPEEKGGAVSVAVDHHDNLWVFQRNEPGQSQLAKFSADHKLLFTVPESVVGHQVQAHDINVDANDNVWICDEYGSTIKEVSPDGKLVRTLGVKGHRGDWVEKIGQRLLWQPVAITFAP